MATMNDFEATLADAEIAEMAKEISEAMSAVVVANKRESMRLDRDEDARALQALVELFPAHACRLCGHASKRP